MSPCARRRLASSRTAPTENGTIGRYFPAAGSTFVVWRPQKMIRMLALAVTVVSVFFAGSASAAELKLLSALVMKPALSELSGDFERTTGHKLTISYDSAGAVKNRLQGGEAADV